jgi:hypothetical protein
MTVSRHDITALILGNDIPVIDATITLDENWSPYVQATLTTPIPDDEIVDLLDPRTNPQVNLFVKKSYGQSDKVYRITNDYVGKKLSDFSTEWAGKVLQDFSNFYYIAYNTFGLKAPEERAFTLAVREININYVRSELSITLSSDEGLLLDYARVANTIYTSPSTSVRTITEYVLGFIGATLQPGAYDATIPAGSAVWEPGQTAYDYLEPIVQAGALRLFCDENRDWYLVPDNYDVPGSVNLSYTETLTDAATTISRESIEWYDAVVIKYEYVDPAGATIIEYDSAGSPGTKVLTLTYNSKYPGPGAAARVLQRAEGRGRVNSISAVNDYTVTPGISCSLTMPNADTQVGNVSAVTWELPGDTMAITTRGLLEVPDTAWIFTPSGVAWEDILPGVSWNTYTA